MQNIKWDNLFQMWGLGEILGSRNSHYVKNQFIYPQG